MDQAVSALQERVRDTIIGERWTPDTGATRDFKQGDVEQTCRMYPSYKAAVEWAASSVDRQGLSPSQYGKAVHTAADHCFKYNYPAFDPGTGAFNTEFSVKKDTRNAFITALLRAEGSSDQLLRDEQPGFTEGSRHHAGQAVALKTFNALDPTPPIKRYIAPLLRRRRDLILSGRWLIMKPVTHYVRGVYFDRSRSKGSLIPLAMVMPLYDEPPRRRIDVGCELNREKAAWDLRELDGEAELCDAIESRALPAIQAVTTPEAYRVYLASLDHWLARILGQALCEFILGDAARAEVLLDELADWSAAHIATAGVGSTPNRFRDLLDLMRREPGALIRQMHEWEAGQVRLMKLEKHWQPTPFPCEQSL